MTTDRLEQVLRAIRAVSSVEVIRLATRVPSALPHRIDRELTSMLRKHQPVWVMSHFNHPKEVTSRAGTALEALADAGLPVMNQSVLLRGINDRVEVLEELFRGLVRRRVRPYYLLQADPVRGSAHLRTTLQAGIDIMRTLQGRLSGIALPKLIVDTPGGLGKVPVGPDFIVERAPGRTRFRTHRAIEVDYLDPPEP
jgi:lysine 2,3-aminomutase